MRSLALPLALLAAGPAAAQDLSLMLDWFVNPDHAPIIVAQELGFFADAGLTVEITAPADPSDPPRMLASGQVDLAVGYQPQLHLQVHEGLPLTRVATLVATPLNCLTVMADGPVQSVADLKGRKVGYSVPGMETALMGAMLDRAGLTLDDVDLVNVGWSLSPALMTGQVDATLGGFRNFEMTQMRLEGAEGRCLFVEEQGIPAYDELILLANPGMMDPDATQRFVAAMERGAHYILNHPEQAWQVFRDAHPDLDDELNRAAWAATLPRFSQSPGAVDHGRYARFEAFLRDAGLIDGVLPVSALATDPGA
ncbi:ABC transporter substrate-binding protein [Paracoccus sp. S3-43]|uniref:ABC transporter substrate-binding protein n=1 Tax=Paracoccus sp. S3-43 TaxID=3030011 RepID=UPI0023B036F3|nr:ABC transporter substrate-binding protein [Paracoccus sp. S3-43]WEF24385.1 ABC transporter substrate-binding protein [Paracoccus sp. S3-43]